MSDKDEIKELFQKELGNYQAKVNPNLWKAVQSGISSSAAASGAGSSIGIAGKLVIGIATLSVITVGAFMFVNSNENATESQTSTQKIIKEENLVGEEKLEKETSEVKFENKNKSEKTYKKTPQTTPQSENQVIESPEKVETLHQKDQKVVAENHKSKEQNLRNEENSKATKAENTNQQKSNLATQEEPSPKTIEKEKRIDLSSVTIEIDQSKNQYVNFQAKHLPKEAQITWDFDDGTIKRTPRVEHFYPNPGKYLVELHVQVGEEQISKFTEIEILVQGEIGELPNVFTPNGDGKNDFLFIKSQGLKTFQITVLNKNQKVVYSSNNPDFKWNGMDLNGTPIEAGTYVYIIVAEDEVGNTINKYQHLKIHR
ncbi:hypothetical protein CW751_01760 [Brumimicrobium salinarum]|uniref:PKD domain-containing protein n=1 Tax=Brumimicrobium salinarum TaxID=2058658 RepID=A0A2I0R676_9FLAO|nr:gliding motility-associated C-terminal domain-containing protein [Brumimicrobium salinarum]PKR82088.1 hypothetical protein CW751_01760 [Brumimicrobium salinarum]